MASSMIEREKVKIKWLIRLFVTRRADIQSWNRMRKTTWTSRQYAEVIITPFVLLLRLKVSYKISA